MLPLRTHSKCKETSHEKEYHRNAKEIDRAAVSSAELTVGIDLGDRMFAFYAF